MLRTNFSTRPFYNERLVQILLGGAALVILGLTAFNVWEWRSLTGRHAQLVARVGNAEQQAVALRERAEKARRSVDRAQLEVVAAAAREANRLIDRRVFSWTELLDTLERTLPGEVRVQAIEPSVDKEGNLTVSLIVLGHRPEEIEQFIEQLEGSGAFRHVYSRAETTNQQGLLEVRLEGWYLPRADRAPAAAAGPQPAKEE